MTEGIQNKIVVITGASSGPGEATARYLAAKGATVVLGARRAKRIDALAKELIAAGYKARAVATDVTERNQVKNLVDAAVQEFGRIDVMLNNAGLRPSADRRPGLQRRPVRPTRRGWCCRGCRQSRCAPRA